MLKIKRVYSKALKSDGYRILTDRLWPHGLSKEKAALDVWVKDLAPSTKLRKWFSHDPVRWNEFVKRYRTELRMQKTAVKELKSLLKKHKNSTLVFAAKDEEHNNAVALKKILKI